jgi:4-amino-4-deoxy-L-arabinose transferase-like glycosyltransferase
VQTTLSDRTSHSVQERSQILVLACCAFVLRFLLRLLWPHYVPTGDAITYALIAQSIFTHHGLPELLFYFPPVFPSLIAAVNVLLRNVIISAQMVSIITGSLLVIPAYWLTKALFASRRAALVAGALVVVNPLLLEHSLTGLSESTHALLLLLGLYVGWQAFASQSIGRAILFGAVMALAFLTRGETSINFFCSLIFLALFLGRTASIRKRLAVSAAALVVFLLLALPYLIYLRQTCGQWILSGKTTYNILRAEAMDTSPSYLDGVRASMRKAYAIAPDARLALYSMPQRGLPGFLVSHPSKTASRFIRNFRWELRQIPAPGWLVIALAMIGLAVSLRSTKNLLPNAYLALQVLPLLGTLAVIRLHPAGIPYGRFWVPYVPLLLVYVGLLADRAWSALIHTIPAQQTKRLAAGLATGLLGVLLLLQIALAINKIRHFDRLFIPYKETYVQIENLQREIARLIPPGSRLMSATPEFFINTRFSGLIFPYDSFDAILRYARTHGVDYILTNIGDNIINQGLGFEKLPRDEVEEHVTLVGQWQGRYFLFKVRPATSSYQEDSPD